MTIINQTKLKKGLFYRSCSCFVAFCFFSNTVLLSIPAHAQAILGLPLPGTMIKAGNAFTPPVITGISFHQNNPLQLDFIVDTGDNHLHGDDLTKEAQKLIHYFFAAVTVPENEMWVNLSPYEKDRIIADGLNKTAMGRDMLAQDYLLKQLSSSLMYPESKTGKAFWETVYAKASQTKIGQTLPTSLFNKIWIIPDKASVYVSANNVFVTESRLKVMLEEDYLALEKNMGNEKNGLGDVKAEDLQALNDEQIKAMREVILPAVEREVNEGEHFANLRQIYQSLILASWYKKHLKNSLLGKAYMDTNKTAGLELDDKNIKEKIYGLYLKAFEKGVFDYTKEDYDSATQQVISRHYFSGGENLARTSQVLTEGGLSSAWAAKESRRGHVVVSTEGNVINGDNDHAMITLTLKNGEKINIGAGDSVELIEKALNEKWKGDHAIIELKDGTKVSETYFVAVIVALNRLRLENFEIFGELYTMAQKGISFEEIVEIDDKHWYYTAVSNSMNTWEVDTRRILVSSGLVTPPPLSGPRRPTILRPNVRNIILLTFTNNRLDEFYLKTPFKETETSYAKEWFDTWSDPDQRLKLMNHPTVTVANIDQFISRWGEWFYQQSVDGLRTKYYRNDISDLYNIFDVEIGKDLMDDLQKYVDLDSYRDSSHYVNRTIALKFRLSKPQPNGQFQKKYAFSDRTFKILMADLLELSPKTAERLFAELQKAIEKAVANQPESDHAIIELTNGAKVEELTLIDTMKALEYLRLHNWDAFEVLNVNAEVNNIYANSLRSFDPRNGYLALFRKLKLTDAEDKFRSGVVSIIREAVKAYRVSRISEPYRIELQVPIAMPGKTRDRLDNLLLPDNRLVSLNHPGVRLSDINQLKGFFEKGYALEIERGLMNRLGHSVDLESYNGSFHIQKSEKGIWKWVSGDRSHTVYLYAYRAYEHGRDTLIESEQDLTFDSFKFLMTDLLAVNPKLAEEFFQTLKKKLPEQVLAKKILSWNGASSEHIAPFLTPKQVTFFLGDGKRFQKELGKKFDGYMNAVFYGGFENEIKRERIALRTSLKHFIPVWMKKVKQDSDHAVENPGGIDFNADALKLNEQGKDFEFKFDDKALLNIDPASFRGIEPVIINITPVTNFFPLLGLNEKEAHKILSQNHLPAAIKEDGIELAVNK